VAAAEVDALLAVEQPADDLHRLGEHLVADADRRPVLAGDVLVEVLAGAQPEGEAVAREDLQRGRLLGDDRRVIADRRTRHVGHEPDALGGVRRGPEDRPGVAGVALLGHPRLEVVRADRELKAGRLGGHHVATSWSGRDCSVIIV
jgi:hypothetical protein